MCILFGNNTRCKERGEGVRTPVTQNYQKNRRLARGDRSVRNIADLSQSTRFSLLNHFGAGVHINFHTAVFLTAGSS